MLQSYSIVDGREPVTELGAVVGNSPICDRSREMSQPPESTDRSSKSLGSQAWAAIAASRTLTQSMRVRDSGSRSANQDSRSSHAL